MKHVIRRTWDNNNAGVLEGVQDGARIGDLQQAHPQEHARSGRLPLGQARQVALCRGLDHRCALPVLGLHRAHMRLEALVPPGLQHLCNYHLRSQELSAILTLEAPTHAISLRIPSAMTPSDVASWI